VHTSNKVAEAIVAEIGNKVARNGDFPATMFVVFGNFVASVDTGHSGQAISYHKYKKGGHPVVRPNYYCTQLVVCNVAVKS